MKDNKRGIYIHIPFCIKKCNYCAFLSFCAEGAPLREYTDALCGEIRRRARAAATDHVKRSNEEEISKKPQIDTVYVGGGTPSVIDVSHMRDIMHTVKNSFNIKPDAEITIEVNPGTLGGSDKAIRDKLQAYKSIGFNRLSIGVQSMNNDRLQYLGRIHTSEDVERDMRIAREAGFDNINLDLIFSVPNESVDDALEDVGRIAALNPEHISCYSLQMEEGTLFYDMAERGELSEIPDDEDRETYHRVCAFLKESGYEHYEISNFARCSRGESAEGFEICDTDASAEVAVNTNVKTKTNINKNANVKVVEYKNGGQKSLYRSRHNSLYWDMSEYIGCGLGASGFVCGIRYKNISNIDKYIETYTGANIDAVGENSSVDEESLTNHILLYEDEQKNSPFDNISEAVFTGLRRREGIKYKDAVNAYTAGCDYDEKPADDAETFFWKVFAEAKKGAEAFAKSGHLIIDNEGMRLTEKGIDISNSIMALFV